MDPNNPGSDTPYPVTNPTQPVNPVSPVNHSPMGRSSNNMRRILIGLVVVLVLVIVSFVIFLGKKSSSTPGYPNYKFSINGQEIPRADFVAAYNYYKSLNPKKFNKTDQLNFIKNSYLENYVLKNEYTHEGNTVSQLNDSAVLATLPAALPANFRLVLAQNSAIKSSVMTKIGLKTRTGEVYRLNAVASGSAQVNTLGRLMEQRLTYYSGLLKSSTPATTIKNSFISDPQIKLQPSIHASVLSMERMSPDFTIIPGQDFVDKTFSTQVGGVSPVFKDVDGNYMTYGIVHVTQAGDGAYDSYYQWLDKMEQGLQVKTDFSDFQ